MYERRDINAFVSSIVDAFSLISRKKSITLTFNPCRDISIAAIDTGKLEKALFNLIGNAFKFTPEKGMITVCVLSLIHI